MAKATQNLKIRLNARNIYHFKWLFLICLVVVLLYTPEILNTNIEQEYRKMPHIRTSQEIEFLKCFRSICKHTIKNILDQNRSTGPVGYATFLVMARILKVKERISSDRGLSEKLAKIDIYRKAIGINQHEIPAHNTFHTLRQRLGPEGFFQIHQSFVLEAHKIGLLTPPILDLPKMVIYKIILIGDSMFFKAVASTKGQKDIYGNWLFTDASIVFGKPHHKHKYPVGHRAHTLTAVSGIPIVSLLAPASESDQNYIMPLLEMALDSYPSLPFACVILDAGYDAEDLHRDINTELNLLPIIIRKPSIKWGSMMSKTGTPLCPFAYPTHRRGIEYNHGRTKFACYRTCLDDPQKLLFPCKYQNSKSRFGWMTYTYFKDDYRRKGPAVPGSRIYRRFKKLRTGIEHYYGLTKENRYHMETNNTYMGHDNVLIHVIEHDIVATLDILYEHNKTGKWSDVLNI
ncbi:MAG TPA: transposase [Desulfobacterales bacterium]|nr:transposase [Desulfobacterales bacterium]